MKKSNIIKGILLFLLGIVLIGSTFVFAADDNGDVDNFLLNLSGSESGSGSEENNVVNNVSNVNNVVNNVNNVNNVVNNTNRSVYNAANKNELSDAGLADSMPVMVLVVVFGISAIYAYKKINDYKKF